MGREVAAILAEGWAASARARPLSPAELSADQRTTRELEGRQNIMDARLKREGGLEGRRCWSE